MFELSQPIQRGRIRQLLGREFHIAKRKIHWSMGGQTWAARSDALLINHLKFNHQSLILRPLSGVDPQLQHNKRRNLQLAIARLDRVVLRPGDTFSVWKLVGRPTRSKGYLDGLVLKQGTIAQGLGGGLCQLGNLLFWIAGHSPLTITERWRHGFDVFPDVNRSIPFGAGATLAYNYVDLQLTNQTAYCFRIHLWLDEMYLHGELFCDTNYSSTYILEERHHQIKQQVWGGYSRHNQIYQIRQNSDGSSSDKLLVENHALMMYEPLLTAA
ncbi:vanW like family protein [Synechococcus sp. BIOS-U3-1]|uniref:VanW family protein n=1 Tax=Synechococcus sp. BIOS-U3-1 TaxID=1400865 RepID=UPI001644239F|nr:VanW family protein [Synechococcus sp. BIOS-U3-1]QNI59022.1 vanW like family protein [Synechococcus sp. BIOS-U3-1]|tara:strand:+ start:1672 stop:2481 length:810 start_codon:yes stop_codon:yes gene_type:complete